MPPVTLKFDTTLADACTELVRRWVEATVENMSQFSGDNIKDMSAGQLRELLAQLLLQQPLPTWKMEALQKVYRLDEKTNSEIRFRWIRLGLRAQWKPVVDLAVAFVTEQGRMKFVRPVYRDLYAWEETRQLAVDTYNTHKDEMMYVTSYGVSKDLQLVV
jgi:leukotriene-A4 hydrolase